MKGLALPIREIVCITDELARYWQDRRLMDQLTVTRGYAELVQMNLANTAYHEKLYVSLQCLYEMAAERGLRSVMDRILQMGIEPAAVMDPTRIVQVA